MRTLIYISSSYFTRVIVKSFFIIFIGNNNIKHNKDNNLYKTSKIELGQETLVCSLGGQYQWIVS